jgi:hypothetical protein
MSNKKIMWMLPLVALLMGSLALASAPTITTSIASNANGLLCYGKAVDAENTTMTIYSSWYKNSVLQPLNASMSVTNNTETLINSVNASSLYNGDEWNCSAQAFDGTDYSSWVDSEAVTIYSAQASSLYDIIGVIIAIGIFVLAIVIIWKKLLN